MSPIISNRAKSALATAGFSVSEDSPIAQLAGFAAQNSGIDPRNYGSGLTGWRAFKSEQCSISQDWRRFKAALIEAASVGVSDADVVDAAKSAFSGRLEWKSQKAQHRHWEYTTGQYFPTEYRKAAASVLEYASAAVRRSRPAQVRTITNIAELKAANHANGGNWFSRGAMAFFGTRIESDIIGGRFFVTSEQPPHGARKYTVREFTDKGDVGTAGEFCRYTTRAEAMDAARTASISPRD